jgi:hypothetical protein
VLVEQVLTEVAGEVAPHRVDVVGVVLRVIEFDRKERSLNTIFEYTSTPLRFGIACILYGEKSGGVLRDSNSRPSGS